MGQQVKSLISQKLGLENAIVQAPMAGGPTTPELVAAVTAAGALGSFGFAYSTAEQIDAECQALRKQCAALKLCADCGWNANFFVFPEVLDPDETELVRARKNLEPLGQRVSVDADAMKPDTRLPVLLEQVETALSYKPSLVSFHLGIPAKEILDTVHRAGSYVAASATSVEEALRVQSSGADFIVAQGAEAGGHRGVFDPDGHDDRLGVAELVEQLSHHCELPIIAAGGIMNGADIAAIRAKGADAVQMGSAFLTVDESGVAATYRTVLKTFGERPTKMTRGFSGRPARGIQNQFIETMADSEVLPFPLQNSLTASLRRAAGNAEDFELMSLWAGTNYHLARSCSVAELIQALTQEK